MEKANKNVGSEVFDVQFREYQDRAVKALYELVEYLRYELKKKPKDFVLFKLEEIAKESKMDPALKKKIIFALNNPEKEFKIEFKPNKK
jgi:hypothetical protein